jgi:hypothetical protein
VAAWLGDTEATILGTYAHFMPDDDRGRRAMDEFSSGVPRMCPQRVGSDASDQISPGQRATSGIRVHSRWK